MEKPIALIIFLLGLVYCIIFSYMSWFQPKKLLRFTEKVRTITKRAYSFMPKWWLSLAFWGEDESTRIWLARIGSTLGVVLLMLYVYLLILDN